jgi:hypothetical protein
MRRLSVIFFAVAILLAGITVAALLVRAGDLTRGGTAVMADQSAPAPGVATQAN